MMRASSIAIVSLLCVSAQGHSVEEHWHQWRGPEANGVSRTAKPPVTWNEKKNIQWRIAIEGNGSTTPIVWKDRVYLLTAINTGKVDPSLPTPEEQPDRIFGIKFPNTSYDFVVLCLDRKTGGEVWRRKAIEHIPHEGHHRDNNFASASPFVDGERIYCWFGSMGLFCYDLNGEKIWERQLGKARMGASLGEGCSPVVHDGKIVILRDHARQSTIEVLDAKTGRPLWKKGRDEPNGWATPLIAEHDGKTQVITCGTNLVRSYDLKNGDIIWQCGGLSSNTIPCPVLHDGVVYCMSGYEGYSLLALPISEKGDITGSDKIRWSKNRGTPYVPSPVLYDGLLYYNQSNQNLFSCVDAKSGHAFFERERLPGLAGVYASPVAADGRVYVTDRSGKTLVLEHGRKVVVLATNTLEDRFHASPALAGNQLFLRGTKYLYCISEE